MDNLLVIRLTLSAGDVEYANSTSDERGVRPTPREAVGYANCSVKREVRPTLMRSLSNHGSLLIKF